MSVVMPVYNGVDFLVETLDSLRAQSLDEFELIAVDDGSTDGSWELLSSYARVDPRFKVERQPQNRGHRATSNRAFELARGRFIARSDQDDVSLPRRLERQAEYLDLHPDVGLVASAYYLQLPRREHRLSVPSTDHASIRWGLLFDMTFCHSSLMFRRELVAGSGAYRFAPAAYDYEVCARLGQRTRLASLLDPQVVYRIHEGGLSTTGRHAMEVSAAAISARQLRRLLAHRRLTRAEITSLRRLGTGREIGEDDLARIPLFLELMARFGDEPGVENEDLESIRAAWVARMVRSLPPTRWSAVARHFPGLVSRKGARRLARSAGRLGRRILGAR